MRTVHCSSESQLNLLAVSLKSPLARTVTSAFTGKSTIAVPSAPATSILSQRILLHDAYATYMHSMVYTCIYIYGMTQCLFICPSCAGVASKRLDGLNWFLVQSLPSAFCKGIRVSPKMTVLPPRTLSQTLNSADF